ncbi:TolB family protein [Streptacidiphilus sp. N1-3]|uniref:TolB family protein n=1 Tax=Streptacidiphilus alkalitolerans TaxID=3342712 RepID=A0ABV6WYE2_9ACTN
MSSRSRTAAAVALTIAVTAGSATVLTGCASTVKVGAGAPAAGVPGSGATGSSTAAPSASASASAPGAPSGPAAPVLNGTAKNGLTISNGTSRVLMNGTSVDFGTVVRDLAWNAGGTRAAFIDGNGNLDTANPDGSGRVLVARAPSGENWSHPTWQTIKANSQYGSPASTSLIFAASKNGVLQVKRVSATPDGKAPQLTDTGTDYDGPGLPHAGNAWPSSSGKLGTTVYANAGTGDIYVLDENVREQVAEVAPGSEPALSPDGETVAFVRSVAGHDHLFTEPLQSPERVAKDLTPTATTDYTEPAWSPDGRTIAARVPNGVATLPSDGSAAPTRISSTAGLPAYRG